MKTCKKCGAELSENMKFCGNCGAPVEEMNQEEPASLERTATEDQEDEAFVTEDSGSQTAEGNLEALGEEHPVQEGLKAKKKKTILIVVIAVVVVLAIVGVVLWQTGMFEPKAEPVSTQVAETTKPTEPSTTKATQPKTKAVETTKEKKQDYYFKVEETHTFYSAPNGVYADVTYAGSTGISVDFYDDEGNTDSAFFFCDPIHETTNHIICNEEYTAYDDNYNEYITLEVMPTEDNGESKYPYKIDFRSDAQPAINGIFYEDTEDDEVNEDFDPYGGAYLGD